MFSPLIGTLTHVLATLYLYRFSLLVKDGKSQVCPGLNFNIVYIAGIGYSGLALFSPHFVSAAS